MKKNPMVLLLATLVLTQEIYAQSAVLFGPPYATLHASYKNYFQKGNEIIALKTEGKNVVIQKFDSVNLSLISSKSFDDFPAGFQIEYSTIMGGKYYFFYSLADKKNKSVQLFSREIDIEQGSFSTDGKQIVSSLGKLSKHGPFGFHLSNDQTKLLVHYTLHTSKDNGRVIGVHVFNPKLETIWKSQVKSSFTTKHSKDLDYAVDNDGTVYFLTEVWTNKKDQTSSQIKLSLVKSNSTELTSITVPLDKKIIQQIELFETPHHYILCAGYYQTNHNTPTANGLFLLKADATGKLFEEMTFPIPFLQQHTSSAAANKESSLSLKEVRFEKDGRLTLIGESTHLEEQRYYTPKGLARSEYFIHHDDILITQLGATGKLAWMKKLPKHQVRLASQGHGHMSYHYLSGERNHYLLFIDATKNNVLPMDEASSHHTNMKTFALNAYEVNKENGSINKITLLNNIDEYEAHHFSITKIIPLDASHFVVEFSKKQKTDVLMKATLTP
jgi:hypothetical protein